MVYKDKIDHVLLFRVIENHLSDFNALEREFFQPDGTNVYLSFNAMLDRMSQGANTRALDATNHVGVIRDLATNRPNGIINFCIQPDGSTHPAECHRQVVQNGASLRRLFAELQEQIDLSGNNLRIIVRYAGEMNTPGEATNPYAGDPDAYKAGMDAVANARRLEAPGVELAFAPAINAACGELEGSGLKSIRPYFPSDVELDVASCTWYCRPQKGDPRLGQPAAVRQLCVRRLTEFFASDIADGLKLGIDEIGGSMVIDQTGASNPLPPHNDVMLQQMLDNVRLSRRIDYCTFFMEVVWGEDVTLEFVKNQTAPV